MIVCYNICYGYSETEMVFCAVGIDGADSDSGGVGGISELVGYTGNFETYT